MLKRIALLSLVAFATSLAACGGGGGGGSYSPPSTTGGSPTVPPPLNATSVGIALPTGTIGVEADPTWGSVGGYTQKVYSQVLAFAPSTTITLVNLSSTTVHTFNVVGTAAGPPANFPVSPTFSTANSGSTLNSTYSSGNIAASGSVTVTLPATPGTFLIGCAYHYASNQMRDVIQVSASATPGPQANPPPSGSGGTGGCIGYYC